jgi:hypothetical protein
MSGIIAKKSDNKIEKTDRKGLTMKGFPKISNFLPQKYVENRKLFKN